MSKLEDKLSASIKPARSKTPSAPKPAPATKKPASDGVAPARPDPDTAHPLHPRRVWPD